MAKLFGERKASKRPVSEQEKRFVQNVARARIAQRQTRREAFNQGAWQLIQQARQKQEAVKRTKNGPSGEAPEHPTEGLPGLEQLRRGRYRLPDGVAKMWANQRRNELAALLARRRKTA